MKIPSRNFRVSGFAFRVSCGKSPGTGLREIPADRAAFTMIEIALCLAIIGFALVAIIGVLPTGLNVQKDNREETIINQDAVSWMNTIRNGAHGYEDLTNYVTLITNHWTSITVQANGTLVTNTSGGDWYDKNGSMVTSVSPNLTTVDLSSGFRIIGLLSTPKNVPEPPAPGQVGTYTNNYITALVRAFSGAAVEKSPQVNATILEGAFTYKLIVENIPFVPVDPASIDLSAAATNGLTAQQVAERIGRARSVQILQTNSRDLRLTFRWPVLPNGDLGNGRVTFRAFTGGWLFPTKDFFVPAQRLYFFQPSTYVQ